MKQLPQKIIKSLLLKPKLRYAEIKPKSVEGNLFTYHLKKLIAEELIAKDSDGYYSLTIKGKQYVDRLSMKTLTLRIQPKISTMLVIENEKGEHLLYTKKREPFIDKVSFVYGKLHLGESIDVSAHRELQEKTGFDTKLTHRGDVYISVSQKGESLIHLLCHIYSGKVSSSKKPVCSDKTVKCFWGKIDKVEDQKRMPGFEEIYALCQKKKSHFFKELEYNVD